MSTLNDFIIANIREYPTDYTHRWLFRDDLDENSELYRLLTLNCYHIRIAYSLNNSFLSGTRPVGTIPLTTLEWIQALKFCPTINNNIAWNILAKSNQQEIVEYELYLLGLRTKPKAKYTSLLYGLKNSVQKWRLTSYCQYIVRNTQLECFMDSDRRLAFNKLMNWMRLYDYSVRQFRNAPDKTLPNK